MRTSPSDDGSPGQCDGPPGSFTAQLAGVYQSLGLRPAHARAAALADCADHASDGDSEPRVAGTRRSDSSEMAPRWLVICAFASIYVIWGSTYLGIRFAIETIPPFLMAGSRFVMAGFVMYAFARLRGAARPTIPEWRDGAIVGLLLLMMANGGVTWAEQTVPTVVAVLIATLTPLWIVLMDSLRPGAARPGPMTFLGLALGFGGVMLIVAAREPGGGHLAEPIGVVALVVASLCWSFGSVFSRHAHKPSSPLLPVGMQMIAGGVGLLVLSLITGEVAEFHWSAVSGKSIAAWVYLILFGSLVGFTAYIWLLRVSTPAKVGTFAYVNPVVALVLGATLGGESVTLRILIGAVLVICAVVMILRTSSRRPEFRGEAARFKSLAPPRAENKQAC